MVSRYGDPFGGSDGAKLLQARVLDDEKDVDVTEMRDEMFVGERAAFMRSGEGMR